MDPARLVPMGEVDRACKLFRIAGSTGWALIAMARGEALWPRQEPERTAKRRRARSSAPSGARTQGGLVNVSDLRMEAPIPETADELCAVARDTGADMREVRIGARATEHGKARSESGELAYYRIVHFATPGAMAGQSREGVEPGLT